MKSRELIENQGDARRVVLAANALVARLRYDVRLQAVYRDWRRQHGEQIVEAVVVDRASDLDGPLSTVVAEIGLSRFNWLPLALLRDMVAYTLVGSSAELVAPALDDLPSGRPPKGGGDYIARDVDWFYRVRVKQPPDTLYAIAKEHVAATGTAFHHSNVRAAIERTENLLGLLTTGPHQP